MHSELPNLIVLAKAIAKVLMGTGIGPGILIVGIVRVGVTYRVEGAKVGKFVGKCVDMVNFGGRRFAQFLVTDVLIEQRRFGKYDGQCPYPDCVRMEYHEGAHEFPRLGRVREGAVIELTSLDARYHAIGKDVA